MIAVFFTAANAKFCQHTEATDADSHSVYQPVHTGIEHGLHIRQPALNLCAGKFFPPLRR